MPETYQLPTLLNPGSVLSTMTDAPAQLPPSADSESALGSLSPASPPHPSATAALENASTKVPTAPATLRRTSRFPVVFLSVDRLPCITSPPAPRTQQEVSR